MKLIKYLTAIFCLFFLFTCSAQSQVFSFETNADTGKALLPKGTMIKAVLRQTVTSKDNFVGDTVSFVTLSDLLVGKALCIPKESLLTGKIVQIEGAKQGRDGYFQILIVEIIFPDGWRTNLAAKIWTRDGTGIIGGGAVIKQEYKKIPHRIEHIGSIVQLVKTGASAMGQERALLAGNEMIIVLEENLQVKYLQDLDYTDNND